MIIAWGHVGDTYTVYAWNRLMRLPSHLFRKALVLARAKLLTRVDSMRYSVLRNNMLVRSNRAKIKGRFCTKRHFSEDQRDSGVVPAKL